MKPRDIARELVFPVTDTAVVLAIIAFALLNALASAAWLLGVWLYVVTVPAFFRYLLYLLEARANGRDAPVPGIELFNWIENFWSLFPLVLLALVVWGTWLIASNLSVSWAIVFAVSVALFVPASMAVLAVTRSPMQSLNPLAIVSIIRACKYDYLLILAQFLLIGMAVAWLASSGTPRILVSFASLYQVVLLFTFTGAVLHANRVVPQVDIPDALEDDEDSLRRSLVAERQNIANHAYGFISRGNRAGGLAHIQQWISQESDPDDARRWFFNEMLGWESKDPALFFAQDWLSGLLTEQRNTEALKLVSRCLLENPAFRPRPGDRNRVLELATDARHDDLLRQLR